jgi:hypothetical protein
LKLLTSGAFVPQLYAAFGDTSGVFTIDRRLLLAEGVTFLAGAGGGFDAADAAPAVAPLGLEGAHLIFGVMHPAAVAENRFSHFNLGAKGTSLSYKHDRPVLQSDDIFFLRHVQSSHPGVTEMKCSLPKLAGLLP